MSLRTAIPMGGEVVAGKTKTKGPTIPPSIITKLGIHFLSATMEKTIKDDYLIFVFFFERVYLSVYAHRETYK